MHDSRLVGRLDTEGDLPADLQGLIHGHRTLGQPFVQAGALYVFKDEVFGFLRLLQAVDGPEVGVVQGGEDLGFALEPGQAFGLLGELQGQGLDGHGPLQPEVVAQVDHSHSPTSQLAIDAVGSYLNWLAFHRTTSPFPPRSSTSAYTNSNGRRVSMAPRSPGMERIRPKKRVFTLRGKRSSPHEGGSHSGLAVVGSTARDGAEGGSHSVRAPNAGSVNRKRG